MTLVAVFRAYDDLPFMTFRNRVWPVKHKTDEELVLFGNRKMVTFMAIQCFMFTLCPAVVGGLHKMTADTKFGIVLGEIVKFVRNKTASEDDNRDQRKDKKLRFQCDRFL